jgi:hypothetical protein
MAERKPQGSLVRAGDIAFLKNLDQDKIVAPKETKDAGRLSSPDKPEFQNRQLTLFQSFLYNTDAERDRLSNAIDLWDSIPRYSISRQAMTKSRINERFLERHETQFQHRGHSYACIISPARVTDFDGQERDYYPSATEELVEDALRKLAIEQQAGYFDKPNFRSGVVFTLYSLRDELKKRGHARSYQEIVLALNVLSGATIEIRAEGEKGEAMSRAPYLPSLVAVSRAKLRDDPKAKWAVQFHPFVTGSIDKVTYRQFNYHLMMSHTTQLARWLHKQLVLKYTFASITAPFEMRYSTIKRDSGLLSGYARERDAMTAMAESLTELREAQVILAFKRKNITGKRGKIEDAVFTLTPSFDFVKDTKAGSKRISMATAPSADIKTR